MQKHNYLSSGPVITLHDSLDRWSEKERRSLLITCDEQIYRVGAERNSFFIKTFFVHPVLDRCITI